MGRALDVEAAVAAVGAAHAPGADEHQLTTSTSTRRPSRADAAFITVLSAATVRPPRPITLPASSSATWSSRTRVPSSSSNDSTETSSGASTSERARYSRSASTGSAGGGMARLDQPLDGVRRLRATSKPVLQALLVDFDGRRIRLRIVVPDRLDDPAVARRALIGHDHAPMR